MSPLAALPWFCAFTLVQALPCAAFAAATSAGMQHFRSPVVQLPMLVVAWIACERMLPRIFPWSLGDAFAADPWLRRILESVGREGSSATCVLVATVGAQTLPRRSVRLLSLAIGIAAGATLLRSPVWPATTISGQAVDGLALVIVQAGIPERAAGTDGLTQTWRRYVTATARAVRHRRAPHLILWPETALPTSPRHDTAWRKRIEARVRRWRAPLLFGAIEPSADGQRDRNVAYLVQQEGSRMRWQISRKQALVPFAESVPWAAELPIGRVWRTTGRFTSAPASGPLVLTTNRGVVRLGVALCYDALASDTWARQVAAGADILVQLADDRWLGPSGASQHRLLVQARATTLRRWLVRVSGSGPSALVAADGAIVADTDFGTAAAMWFTLPIEALPR